MGQLSKYFRELGEGDLTYSGFGSNSQAMWKVLNAKFAPNSALAQALLDTGDAFLLEHNDKEKRDRIWSNNSNGKGLNWLGLELMLLRDILRGSKKWTTWIEQNVGPKEALLEMSWIIDAKKIGDDETKFDRAVRSQWQEATNKTPGMKANGIDTWMKLVLEATAATNLAVSGQA